MMAFNDIPGNSTWKTVKCDNEIVSLANGSEPDKFDQILDLLKLNKQYYLENGTTENEWLDRVSGFACQRPYVSTTNEERSKGEELGFYEDLGSPDWEASQNDSKITDLANGSESDKYDQILNKLIKYLNFIGLFLIMIITFNSNHNFNALNRFTRRRGGNIVYRNFFIIYIY